jgi:hypothetical protein
MYGEGEVSVIPDEVEVAVIFCQVLDLLEIPMIGYIHE